MMQSQVVHNLFKKHFEDKFIIVGIEIGTKCADLTISMLDALSHNCFIYTIDSWEHREGAEFEAGELQSYHDKNKEIAYNRLARPENINCVKIISCRSEYAIKLIEHKEVDFVWIDGDHSEEGIIKDLDNYEKLVKPGGILGGHDFGQCHPLTEIIQERYNGKIITGDDFTWWIIK
jgi:hypothetical protein